MGNKTCNPIVCAELLIDCLWPQEWCVFGVIFQSMDVTAKQTAVLRGLPVILGDEDTDFFKKCFVSHLHSWVFIPHHRMSTLFNSAPYVALLALVSCVFSHRNWRWRLICNCGCVWHPHWNPDHCAWGPTDLPWLTAPSVFRYHNMFGRRNCDGWPWKSSTCHVLALWTYLCPEFGVPSTTEV